jgi:hypothetical protein
MIARIILGEKLILLRWVSHHLVKINHSIKDPRFSNPFINSLSRSLTVGVPVNLASSCHWGDRRSNNCDFVPVQTLDYLIIGLDYAVSNHRLGGFIGAGCPYVIDAFEDDRVADTWV